jgi:two-component system, NarL family, nitrate/nitrite response regulator NarL
MINDIQVGIVCSSDIVREGVRRILTSRMLAVVAVGDSVSHLLDDNKELALNLIVIVGDPENVDTEQWREARNTFPDARLALTLSPFDIDLVTKAFEQGVDGVLTEDLSSDQMAASLRLIASGQKVVPSRVLEHLLDTQHVYDGVQVEGAGPTSSFSDRETMILRCLVAGDANKVISRRLGITEAMVKVHIKSILRKLNVTNRTQAAIWAVAHGSRE